MRLDAARTQASAEASRSIPAWKAALKAKADANQKVKEKVGVEINTAISVYKQTHLK